MQLKQSLIAGAVACAFNPAFAEDIQTFDMGEIVVTATRTPTPVRELLNDISVIRAEEIAQSGQTTLPELLRTLPGVEFSANGGPGTNSSVFIRGTNANHALVLVDGLRFNTATNGAATLEKIPLAQIERIEVLRGPGSHLYGSEAIGGVIQIFTKSANAKPGFHIGGGIGSRGLYQASAGGNGKLGGIAFALDVAHESTDSFSAIGNPASSSYNADTDPYRNTSVNGKLHYTIAPGHELSLNAFHSVGSTHYDGRSFTPSIPASFDFRNEQTLSAYALQSRNQLGQNWKSLLRLGTSADDLRSATPSGVWTQIRTDQNQALWQNDISTRVGLFTLGTERIEQRITSDTAYALKQRTIQSYFAGYQGRHAAHSVQVNLRNDRNSQFGGHVTRSAAYGYQFAPAWRAAASIGTAYRAPSFNDLYWPNTGSAAGNPNLKPEESLNREAALHHDQGAHHTSVTWFDNRVANLINWTQTSPGFYQPSNVNRARITGTTLAYSGRIGDTTLRASATFQKPLDSDTRLLLTRRARRTASAGIEQRLGNWSAGGDIVASSQRFDNTTNTVRLGGYALLNLNAAYRYSQELSFVARLNNALDKQYELAQYFNTPDRNVFVGFDYHPK